MITKLRLILALLFLACVKNVAGQAPNITYSKASYTLAPGAAFSISPANSGGAVPATTYGNVTSFVGSPSGIIGYWDASDTSAWFNFPQQMVMDASGNLYVADSNNNAIRKVTPAGVVTVFAGDTTGLLGLVDSTGTAALFNYPDGIAIDGGGNLFVADYSNNAIRKITPVGAVSTFYITTNSFGPGGLCFDHSGNLIVAAQDGNQVISINPAGVATVIAGSTAPGYANGPAASAKFNYPSDVRMDPSGNLYVVDLQNNAIRKITPSGVVSTFAGSAVSGNTPGYADGVGTAALFNNPGGLAFGPGGVIYVCDMGNQDIRRIMPDGTVSLLAGSPVQAIGNDNGTGAAAAFSYPDYIYIDNTGTAYVAELLGSRIRKVVLTGYSITGTLPPGLTFDPTTGSISGTPTAISPSTAYTITGYNTSGFSSAIVNITVAGSSNANLSAFKISKGTLTPFFATGTTSYTANVVNGVASMTVTPTTADPAATIQVNGTAVVSGTASAPIELSPGSNTITTVVTAQDGVTTKTYTLVVTEALSTNANLASLKPGRGSISPVFSASTTAYTESVTNSVSSITVTPTTAVNSATVTINGTAVTSGMASGPIALVVGSNIITTLVTAGDGVTTKTYTITITRAPSGNANLSAFKISRGTLAPAFNPNTTIYTASVVNGVTSMTVTPTSIDPTATIQVNGTVVTSGTPSGAITLAIGSNTITTVVTAQDGTTIKTYTLTVTRATGPIPIAANSYNQGISISNPNETPIIANDGLLVHPAISPNGDGINDFLQIDNIVQYPDNKLSIINRNGQLIFEAKGYDNSSKVFDGHSNKNGQMQLPGTYFYQLDYTAGGVVKHKTGYLVLKY